MGNIMLDAVAQFHKAMDISHRRPFPTERDESIVLLGKDLVRISQDLEKRLGDDPSGRALRAHLSHEEYGEWLIALGECNEIDASNALADRLYVLLGDADMYDLPLIEEFAETHRSNMTKVPQDDDPSKARVRVKGDKFSPPNTKAVLERHRSGQRQLGVRPGDSLAAIDRAYRREAVNVSGLSPAQTAKVMMLVEQFRVENKKQ